MSPQGHFPDDSYLNRRFLKAKQKSPEGQWVRVARRVHGLAKMVVKASIPIFPGGASF
jgi:hypothetical protein